MDFIHINREGKRMGPYKIPEVGKFIYPLDPTSKISSTYSKLWSTQSSDTTPRSRRRDPSLAGSITRGLSAIVRFPTGSSRAAVGYGGAIYMRGSIRATRYELDYITQREAAMLMGILGRV